jgi:hypothetical protein
LLASDAALVWKHVITRMVLGPEARRPADLERLAAGGPPAIHPGWLLDLPGELPGQGAFESVAEGMRRHDAGHGAERRRAAVDRVRARIVALCARL